MAERLGSVGGFDASSLGFICAMMGAAIDEVADYLAAMTGQNIV